MILGHFEQILGHFEQIFAQIASLMTLTELKLLLELNHRR